VVTRNETPEERKRRNQAGIAAAREALEPTPEPEPPRSLWWRHWEDGASREHAGMQQDAEQFARQDEVWEGSF